jgi:2-oxoglutarate ferredoxin oxidoreductase subunit gamma
VEFSVLVTGIGGQGIQLLSKVLALAATDQGRHAMLSAEVGGEMRGGPSLSSVVIGDEPVRALPILERADAVIVSHHRFAAGPLTRLDSGGLCLINSSIVDTSVLPAHARVVEVAATGIAKELGATQASGLVLLGAFNAICGLVEPQRLVAAMERLLPPYRRQHAPVNASALERGAIEAGAAV